MSKKKFFAIQAENYKRLAVIVFFLFLLFFCLIIQFYKVQILEHDKWTNLALGQHRCYVEIPFKRGRFFSNGKNSDDGQLFVTDVKKYHLFIDPNSIKKEEKENLIAELFNFFDFSQDEKNKIKASFYKNSRSRKLVSWIDKEKKDLIQKWWFNYISDKKIVRNALFFIQDFKRSYCFGSLLGQVLHTVRDDKDPAFQGIPTGGLELYFNDYLKGVKGKREIIRSPRNSLGVSNVIKNAENGADIHLTINQYLQAIVEEELAKGVKKVNAKSGWAVVMDPSSGEILALGQYPFFDVGNYAKYFNDKELEENTKLKIVTDAFEPASIFKPITLAVCLKANEELERLNRQPLFYPMEKIETGSGNFKGVPKPLKDGRRHNFLNMYMAVQKSSNVYMGQLINRLKETLGDDWYRNALKEMFRFGEKTHIEYPGENGGFLPEIGKTYQNGALQWSAATPYYLAIGHNISVNGIQMLKAYGMIANYGLEVQPFLVKKIVKKDLDGKEVVLLDNVNKEKNCRRILSKANAAQIINAMKFTTKLGGTAYRGDIKGYTEAGKSGTSEKIINGRYSDKAYISLFAGMTPANNTKLVILVAIDEPEKRFIPGEGKSWHGGVCAAPVFKEIGRRALEYLGVEPDDPFSYSYAKDRLKADWLYEVSQMSKLYKEYNETKKTFK